MNIGMIGYGSRASSSGVQYKIDPGLRAFIQFSIIAVLYNSMASEMN
jgi:hypothetical protein